MPRALLILPAVLTLLVFLFVPYGYILLMSLRPGRPDGTIGAGITLANYADVFGNAYDLYQIGNTLFIGIVATLASLLLGFPVAWNLARRPGRSQAFRQAVVLSPLLVGIVVRSYGWTILLGNNGVLNRAARGLGLTSSALPLMYDRFGIIVALTHVFLPFMILPILNALQNVDPALEQAGRSLGAAPRAVFSRVILPLAMPGIQSGCVMVFILSMSAYVTPMLIGGMRVTTMPMTVVSSLIDSFQWPLGAAQALALTLCGGLVVIAFIRMTPMRWNR